jgi:hypothetical protein
LNAIAELKFHQDPFYVGPDRGLLDSELSRDLAVREPTRDQVEDLALARSELVDLGLISKLGSGLLGPCCRSRGG